jgi:GntP family gluconate:H+ symporter
MISGLAVAFSLPPLLVVALSVVCVVAAVAVVRLNAFFALMLAALFAGLATALGKLGDDRFVKAVESVMTELGSMVGKLGFTIALASVIGMCLMESGAADKIIRRFMAVLGESHAAFALLAGGFLLAAPVFVDTVVMLLLPLARALSLRTGKNYLLYVIAIAVGAAVTNGLVPPAPGPLFVAEALGLHAHLGIVIVAGFVLGVIPALSGLALAGWFNARIDVPVRPTQGSSLESLKIVAERSEAELPGFAISIAPVLLPVLFIAASSSLEFVRSYVSPEVAQWVIFLGNKNVALLIGAVIALIVYAREKKIGWRSVGKTLGPPLETAGVIILVVSAGGAFGAMIKNTGIGDSVRAWAGGGTINYVLLGWTVAAFLRAVQGSATVATITATGILLAIAGKPSGFGVHPLYVLAGVGFGSKFLAWMNDAGFWVLCRLGGLTQGETLRSWTIVVSAVSLIGLIEVLIVSAIFPQLPF